jgi:hypothetical protein
MTTMLKSARSLLLVFAVAFLVCAWAGAGTIEKKYADGTLKLKYEIDEKGDKEGAYEEFYPDGKPKVKATYKGDKLNGPYKTFHENGKPAITAAYKDGELTGSYVEETPEGQKKLTCAYKQGKLHGTLTRYEKGKPVLTQIYTEGEPAYPRSLDEIKKKLAEIANAPTKPGADTEREAALRKLKAYRYLAEVPYESLELDDNCTKGAQAAAAICEKIGKLDHFPKNPGLPDAEFKVAADGARSSNLAAGMKRLDMAVDMWMYDSDPSNIAGLGHRRWCLNPAMGKTGFGIAGRYAAMWSNDSSLKNVPDYEFIAFPPRGLMPVEFFSPNHAWNISLHPRKFRQPTDAAQPKVFALDATFTKAGEPLKLNFSQVSRPGFGVPYCLVFRPDKLPLGPGRRYLVEVDGLTRSDGKPAQLSYVVEFVSVR